MWFLSAIVNLLLGQWCTEGVFPPEDQGKLHSSAQSRKYFFLEWHKTILMVLDTIIYFVL